MLSDLQKFYIKLQFFDKVLLKCLQPHSITSHIMYIEINNEFIVSTVFAFVKKCF